MSTLESQSWSAPPLAIRSTRDDPHGWGFFLLCCVVASLYVRPSDLIQAFHAWPIYQVLIIACFGISLRSLAKQMSPKQMQRHPAIFFIGLLVVTAGTSHLWHGAWWEARDSSWRIAKLAVLFLLILGLVNHQGRLLTFIRWQVVVVTLMTTLALADHYHFFEVVTIDALREIVRGDADDAPIIERLRGTGIFEDPNDLGMVLVFSLVLCVSFMTQKGIGWLRYWWLFPAAILVLGLAHTYSRGALLSLAAAVPAWFYIRGGRLSALLGSLMLIPLLILLFSGRMTDVDAIFDGTGQSRILIWSDALQMFRSSPIFGMGEGMFYEEFGVVTHNSFLQTFAELGFVGGAAFLALFVLGSRQLLDKSPDPSLEHFRGFLFAALVGYGVGLMTLSRQFEGPTFLVLGLAAAAHNVSDIADGQSRPSKIGWLLRALLAAIVFLVAISLLVRVLVHR